MIHASKEESCLRSVAKGIEFNKVSCDIECDKEQNDAKFGDIDRVARCARRVKMSEDFFSSILTFQSRYGKRFLFVRSTVTAT